MAVRIDAPDVALLRVVADLDLATAPAVEQELATLLSAGDATGTVILDFDSDTFVGVRGLRLLLDIDRRLRGRGGRLFVCTPPAGLKWMVQVLDVDLDLITDVHDALRAARDPDAHPRSPRLRRTARRTGPF